MTGSTISTTAAANLTAIGGLVNPAYSALSTTLYGAFGQLHGTILPGAEEGSTVMTTTVTPFATVLDTGVSTLAQTLTNGLASTPAASATGLLQSQLTGALTGSLTTRFDTLTTAAGIQGQGTGYETVDFLSDLGLITVAYEAALDCFVQLDWHRGLLDWRLWYRVGVIAKPAFRASPLVRIFRSD